ncbi:MAG: hypothetical protein D8M61_06125 [Ignavibacteriae bacterium]|nr:hypothetical protein [Ignavibacteriota bacterium]
MSLREIFSKQSVNLPLFSADCFVIKNIPRNDGKFYFPKIKSSLVYIKNNNNFNISRRKFEKLSKRYV